MAEELPLIADFTAQVRRPKPLEDGMLAELFAVNGKHADAILPLGRSDHQDALVDVALHDEKGEGMGAFRAYVRRPHPLMSGMIARFFGENGDAADAITALSLSRFQDQTVRVVVRLVQLPDGREVKKKPSGPFAKQASVLWTSTFLEREQVWRACGTDEEFLNWVRAQACCIKPEFGACEGIVVPMHVRRIAHGAGERLKPPYSAIPGCWHHHQIQSDKGESAVGGRAYYDEQRLAHLRKWCWECIKTQIGADSMADADPAAVRAWAVAKDIAGHLPITYR